MKGWIFQGNPKKFNVDNYLLFKKDITWLVRPQRYSKEIQPGEIAFIWRADGSEEGSGGVVAQGEVLASPAVIDDDAPHLWIEPIVRGAALRVRIAISETRLSASSGMLGRLDLKQHPLLKDLWILGWRSQTVYPLSPEHLKELFSLWEASRLGRGSKPTAGS
jgi:hypothetical protein